ncbi:Nn.00g111150.m01.CDS01 [Neocucurbitaria sp. VM-36]
MEGVQPQPHQQQYFGPNGPGNGLGGLGNGGQPPNNNNQHDPVRGHYVESIKPTDMLKAMREAGVGPSQTGCFHCGERVALPHRMNWRECTARCPFCSEDEHQHIGQPCPKLMTVANAAWCWAHARNDFTAEREAVRDPNKTRRRAERRAATRAERMPPPNRQAHMPLNPDNRAHGYGESLGRYQDRRPSFDVGHSYSSYGRGYDRPYDRRDFRERSPLREPSVRYSEYRERAPLRSSSQYHSSSPASGQEPDRSVLRRERTPPSTEGAAKKWAALRSQFAALPPVPTQAPPRQETADIVPHIKVEVVEDLDSRQAWTEFTAKEPETATQKGETNASADNVTSEPQAPATITMTKQEFDTALRKAAEEGIQTAISSIAAYQLIFEDKLPREEEDSRWPWLRDVTLPEHPDNWGQRVGYSLQMRLLYQANNAGSNTRAPRELDPNILQRPTGVLPAALNNWFYSIELGALKARVDFLSQKDTLEVEITRLKNDVIDYKTEAEAQADLVKSQAEIAAHAQQDYEHELRLCGLSAIV